MTQSQLAQRAGVAVSVITVAERAERPDADTASSDKERTQWRHSTAIKVYRALSSVKLLDADERARFKEEMGIRFLADGIDDATELPANLPAHAEAEVVDLTNRLRSIYNQFGYRCASHILHSGMELMALARSRETEDWRASSWHDKRPAPAAETYYAEATRSGKAGTSPKIPSIDASKIPSPGASSPRSSRHSKRA